MIEYDKVTVEEFLKQMEEGIHMNRQTKIFNVGDYIGDRYDNSWEVKESTEYHYIAFNSVYNQTIEIIKNPNMKNTNHKEYYAKDFFLIRPKDHPDIIKFPIGSKWKCMRESGLNDPQKDTVIIVNYAYSEGVFWVCNSNKSFIMFIADARDLLEINE